MQNWNSRRDAEKHYDVMKLADVLALPVGDLASKDAHLFLWTTGPCLRIAFDVIEAWGFRYSSIAFTWIKLKRRHDAGQLRFAPLADSDLHVGLGLTTRKNAEFCLLARRGNARRIAKDVREVILSPVREHSRKPDEAAARIARYCAGPYLEMFARERRPGWTSWGQQVDHFTPPAADDYDPVKDSHDSYFEAMRAIGDRVKTGEPLPAMFVPSRRAAE
jgi:N6-adenosine-specific RNA methylase IME4